MVDHTSPLSWRDVYKAVNDSETRIIAAVNTAVEPLVKSSADHELRLRKLEMEGSSVAHDAKRSVDALWIKHDALKLAVDANTNSRKGALETVGLGRQAIILIMAMMGTAIAVAEFIK